MKFTDEEITALRELAAERIAQKRAAAEEQQQISSDRLKRETARRKDFEEVLRNFYALTLPDAEAKQLAAEHAGRLLDEPNKMVERRFASAEESYGRN